MKNNIYCLYNTLSKRYGDVFAYPSDGMAEKRTRQYIASTQQDLNEFELCRIGSIDLESGINTPCGTIRIAWSEVQPKLPTKEANNVKTEIVS